MQRALVMATILLALAVVLLRPYARQLAASAPASAPTPPRVLVASRPPARNPGPRSFIDTDLLPKLPLGPGFDSTDPPKAAPVRNPTADMPPPPSIPNFVVNPTVGQRPTLMPSMVQGSGGANPGWMERVSSRAQPEVRVTDIDAGGATFSIWGPVNRSWSWNAVFQTVGGFVPPGRYRYELRSDWKQPWDAPDVAGVLVCGKYRTYELIVTQRDPWGFQGTIYKDLGDVGSPIGRN